MRAVSVLLVLCVQLTSCQKIMEYYSRQSIEINTTCKIDHYTYDYFGSTVRTSFEYNSKGAPVSITYFDELLPGGQGKEIFQYDHLNRLTHHVPDEFIGNRRQYIYEGNNTIPLRDTATDSYGNKYVESFEFDAAGRIIREEIKWVFAAEEFEDDPNLYWTEVKRYYYDVHGNRQVNPFDRPWHPTIRYSEKPSLYSLHPTWQLVFRDYSKNNASMVRSHNEQGLPVTFIIADLAYWQPFFDLNQNAVISYQCK